MYVFFSKGEVEAIGKAKLTEFMETIEVKIFLHQRKMYLMEGMGPIKYSLKTFPTNSQKLPYFESVITHKS